MKTLIHSFCLTLFIAITLSACGSSREIQKDGSGSDEMLKSPCVCLPIPHDAPNFTWGRA